MAQTVINLPAMQGTRDPSLGREDPLEKEMQPTPVFLPGEIPWTEAPGGLQSMGSQSDKTNTFTFCNLNIVKEKNEITFYRLR